MSLLSSIFGSKEDSSKEEKGLDTLFTNKEFKKRPRDPEIKIVQKNPKDHDDNQREDELNNDNDGPSTTSGDNQNHDSTTEKSKAEEDVNLVENSKQVENVDERTIFVGNLPNNFSRKALQKIFSPCGPIESTRIRSVATTFVKVPQKSAGNQKLVKKVSANTNQVDADAKPNVVGYVVFKRDNFTESIEKALKLNNTQVDDPITKTRTIRVDHSKSEFDASRSVFVGSLPYKTDEESLRKHFCDGCGIEDADIEGIRVVRDKETYQCKGFAYILFKDKNMTATALRLMHQSSYMNRELRVLVCSRRYNSNSAEGRPKKKKKMMRDGEEDDVKPGVAALRRILEKEDKTERGSKHKRARGKKPSGKPTSKKATGKSRKAAIEAKVNKRVKKLEKRMTKGMGKTKHA